MAQRAKPKFGGTREERQQLALKLKQKNGVRAYARHYRISPSTVSRILRRAQH